MGSNAISSFGIELYWEVAGSPATWTKIAEIKDFSGPKLSLGTEETNSHDSASSWKTRIPTMLDGGEITFDINYSPANSTHSMTAGLLKKMVDRTNVNWKIIMPDTGDCTWTFSGYVTGFEVDAPVEGVLGASVTITINGAISESL